jgi:hypothetical protein
MFLLVDEVTRVSGVSHVGTCGVVANTSWSDVSAGINSELHLEMSHPLVEVSASSRLGSHESHHSSFQDPR